MNEEENKHVDTNEARQEPHLEVYAHSSMLIDKGNAVKTIWLEGKQTQSAQQRYGKVIDAFKSGFLDGKIEIAKSARIVSTVEFNLTLQHKNAIEDIVASITSQNGRALVEIFLLQLAIKTIVPEQDIRLHKGNSNRNQNNDERGTFSWVEGISMRSLDDKFVVPTLRKYGLVRMNEYGAFMTRSFAENYPYTLFYKAETRGAKKQWLLLVEALEENRLDAEAALLYVLDLLWKNSEQFVKLSDEVLQSLANWFLQNTNYSIYQVSDVIKHHIDKSEARARLLEIAMHTLLQALEDVDVDMRGQLKPLMPMRTANLKHRNFGDIEIVIGDAVVESWDAKYDNPYLSDALDVFVEKIRDRNITELSFGYVLYPEKKEYVDVTQKITAVEDDYGIQIQVLSFDEWVQMQVQRSGGNETSNKRLAYAWLQAYAESLALRRESKAPIDEPTYDWLLRLKEILQS